MADFYGKMPRSFVKGCYSLKVLKLSHNKLSGQIFPESANFTDIFVLSMDNNQFTGNIGQGEIPVSLFNLSNLQLVDLSANNLSGNIPPHVNSKYPVVLFLQDNNFSGSIPDTLLRNVQVLDLRINRLFGNIPEFIDTQNISILLLRGNRLTGRIPHQLCALRKLQLLDLSNNRLNGSIPSCLSNTSLGLGKEPMLYSYDLRFIYSAQAIFGHAGRYFKSLLILDPASMDYRAYTKAKVEFATKHRFDAYMGGNLKLLFGMDLSENELSGEIPVELGGLGELQALNLSHNKLSGVIPESFSGLKNVESLDLSFNRLQGRIPPQLTELSSLSVFNVSYNNLAGVIPEGKQFNTFDTPSYLGNPLLCGQPTNRNCCSNTGFQESDNEVNDDEESRIDMVSFNWSFAAAYVTILVGIFASLSFDSPWSRFWFGIVDVFILKARNLLW